MSVPTLYQSLSLFPQTVENPFTETDRASGSPVSIGEAVALQTIPEDRQGSGGAGGARRRTSNPFQPGGEGSQQQQSSSWERERHQFITQLTLMNEQLKAERASRVESQVCVCVCVCVCGWGGVL